jgi:hypothetical protein
MPIVWKWEGWSRAPVARQGRLAFMTALERRERAFKRSIVALTAVAVVGLAAGTRMGRNATGALVVRGRALVDRAVGMPPERSEYDARLRETRLANAAAAREALAQVAPADSALGVFLREARMDAGSAVVRWGNIDRSIVLSSAVFEPDDERSYRLRPGVRSVWAIGLSFQKTLALFLIPDTPQAREAARLAGGHVVPESVQTTNSWGCRGPEPDTKAPVRVMVLGDSMMQGALVGDAQTPPVRLEAELAEALGAPVSVLNTGHVGYSPEQYEASLRVFHDRFRPQYVVINITDNDFGDLRNPADWAEGEYWIDRIAEYCSQHSIEFLLVPAPEARSLLGRRDIGRFQAHVDKMFKRGGINYVDPLESFTDRFIRLRNEQMRLGQPLTEPLYNLHLLGDRHFSALGSELWAKVVARRVLLAWGNRALTGMACPEPVARHARTAHPSLPVDEAP